MIDVKSYSFIPAFYSDKTPDVKLINYSDVLKDFSSRPETMLTEIE